MLAHRSKVWWLEVEMLGVIPEEGAWGAALATSGAAASIMAYCKSNTEHYLLLVSFSFFVKVKILFEFLLVSENRY